MANPGHPRQIRAGLADIEAPHFAPPPCTKVQIVANVWLVALARVAIDDRVERPLKLNGFNGAKDGMYPDLNLGVPMTTSSEKDPSIHDKLSKAISAENDELVRVLLADCRNINARIEDGETHLFTAVLSGNMAIVNLLLEAGADVNAVADEPAAEFLAPNPLSLAVQCRFLINWEKYAPIVELLVARGATLPDGTALAE